MSSRKQKDVTTKELEKLVENKSVIKKLTANQRKLLLWMLKRGKVVFA